MISSNDLKPGNTILVDNEIYVVLDISQNKTARSAMVVKAKVRNLRSGSNIELSWGGGEKVTPAEIENAKCSIYMIPKILWFSWIMKPMIKLKFPVNV